MDVSGEQLLHSTCVAFGAAGVLLLGAPGAGKSDLALRLMSGGASLPHLPAVRVQLVSDDQVRLTREQGKLIARPPERIAGRIEVRGAGIITVPYLPAAEVRLAVRLVPFEDVPRLPPDPPECETFLNVSIPILALDPFEASAALKLTLCINHLR